MHVPISKHSKHVPNHLFREFDRVKTNRLDPSQHIRSLVHVAQQGKSSLWRSQSMPTSPDYSL